MKQLARDHKRAGRYQQHIMQGSRVYVRYSPLSPVRGTSKKNEKRKRAEAVEDPSPGGVWGGNGRALTGPKGPYLLSGEILIPGFNRPVQSRAVNWGVALAPWRWTNDDQLMRIQNQAGWFCFKAGGAPLGTTVQSAGQLPVRVHHIPLLKPSLAQDARQGTCRTH